MRRCRVNRLRLEVVSRRDDEDDREQLSSGHYGVLPMCQRFVLVGAMLTSAAFIWPWPRPQNSEHAISYSPAGGAVNSVVTGPPLSGMCRSILSLGMAK